MMRTLLASRRFYEILIPCVVWLLITLPLWLSPFSPETVAYVIIAFNVFYFYKTIKTVWYASLSYLRIKTASALNWMKKVEAEGIADTYTHYIMIANYKESYRKLTKTLDAIAEQTLSTKQVHIVLAMEDAEGLTARTRAQRVIQDYRNRFASVQATYHVLAPGEVRGKASNENYCARIIAAQAKALGLDFQKVIVTTSDADSLFDRQYLAYLTHAYHTDPSRIYHFYWSPLLLYSNYWNLNFFIRIQTTISSILRLGFLAEEQNLIQISTYSMSLWLLEEVGFWDADIIPEDWHIFLQAFVKFGTIVQTKPIYLITAGDGIIGDGMLDILKNRYDQEKRWAWGVTDIPFAMSEFAKTSYISWWDKIFRILSLVETHILWPSSFFILTIGALIPTLVNPYFKTTTLGFLLPRVAGGILTLTTSFVIVIAYLDYQAKRHFLKKREHKRVAQLMMQWVLFPVLSPIISAVLSSIPALESHTRMLLNKPIHYKVTKKT